jgi:hypothetical protein
MKFNASLNNIKIILFQIIVFLIIFPEFGIIRLQTDTQPYYVILIIFSFFISNKIQIKINYIILPFLFMLCISTFSLSISYFNSTNKFNLLRSYYGYISSTLILFYFLNNVDLFVSKNIIGIIDTSIVFIYIGFLLNLFGLNFIVQLFVNRAEFRFDGVRGLVSFFSEQSNMVTVCVMLLLILSHFNKLDKLRFFSIFLAIVATASGQLVIEFVLLLLFYLLAFIIQTILKSKLNLSSLKRIIISFFSSIIIFWLIKNINLNFRVFEIFKNINLEQGLIILGSDYSFSWKVQGIFLAISTLLSDPFIFQISSLTETNSFDRLSEVYASIYISIFNISLPRFGERVYSVFGTWIVDFGIVGMLAYLSFVLIYMKALFLNNKYNIVLFISFLYILYASSFKIGLSFPTLYLLIFSTYIYAINEKQKSS